MLPPSSSRQQGAVLVVSLMILTMMTIIGVTALNTTTLEERMALNRQHTNLSFQGAESQIQAIINVSNPNIPGYSQSNDLMLTTLKQGFGGNASVGPNTTTAASGSGNATLKTSATITYTSAPACPNQELGKIVCHTFEIKSTATVASTGASQTHIQGVTRLGPGS